LFGVQEAVTAVAAGDVKPSEQGKYPVKQQQEAAAAKPSAPTRPLPKSAVPVVNSEVREGFKLPVLLIQNAFAL